MVMILVLERRRSDLYTVHICMFLKLHGTLATLLMQDNGTKLCGPDGWEPFGCDCVVRASLLRCMYVVILLWDISVFTNQYTIVLAGWETLYPKVDTGGVHAYMRG